jgi:hypothetical protein
MMPLPTGKIRKGSALIHSSRVAEKERTFPAQRLEI